MNSSSVASSSIHTYTVCPVCDCSKLNEKYEIKDYTVSGGNFKVWECENCQLRFTQDIPVISEIGAYYQSEEYISHSNTNQGLVNRLYQMVRTFTLKQKLKLVRRASGKKTGRLLDIGCGTGEFLHTMNGAGWEVLGLEPEPAAREQVLKNFGLDAKSNEELFELEENTRDVVSMWHVLEHVHQLNDYIATIHKILKEDGLLIIAVPNYQSLDADRYQAHWAAYDVPRHLYHFSPQSMETLLTNHRFELKRMKHMPFDPFYVSLLSEKYLHGKTRLIPAFWTGFRSWMQSTGNVRRGSSIIYMAKPVKS